MATYNDESRMPFGAHKDKKLIDVPASYLIWIYGNIKDLELGLKEYIKENMNVLEKENKQQYKHNQDDE